MALSPPTYRHVFVCVDVVRPPLSRPYEGPFTVISKSTDLKTFTLDRSGRPWVVSVDRLKSAYFLSDPLPLGNAATSPDPDDVLLGPDPPAPATLVPSANEHALLDDGNLRARDPAQVFPLLTLPLLMLPLLTPKLLSRYLRRPLLKSRRTPDGSPDLRTATKHN